MATLSPGQAVTLRDGVGLNLAWPPPATAALYIAVHRDALRAGSRNLLTLVTAVEETNLLWVGAIDEGMVSIAQAPSRPNARALIAGCLFQGPSAWRIIRPGLLTTACAPRPYLTVYDNDRPWVVLGSLSSGSLLCAPLNDARGNPKWWAPQVPRPDLLFPGSKDSQIELAHLWSLGPGHTTVGEVAPSARTTLSTAIRGYIRAV
jgi:hypothetical protein